MNGATFDNDGLPQFPVNFTNAIPFAQFENPSWVADDDIWEKAKKAALKSYDEGDEGFWAVVASIYRKMGGEVK